MVRTRSSTATERGQPGKISLKEIYKEVEEQESTTDAEDDEEVEVLENFPSKRPKPPPPPSSKPKNKGTRGGKRKSSSSGSKKNGANKKGTLFQYFAKAPDSCSSSSSSSPEVEVKKRKVEVKPCRSPKTLEFLYSGLPDVVIKAQKVVEKKKLEEDRLQGMELYPKFQSTEQLGESVDNSSSKEELDGCSSSSTSSWVLKPDSCISKFLEPSSPGGGRSKSDPLCCHSSAAIPPLVVPPTITATAAPLPWVHSTKVLAIKGLCCDGAALSQLTSWLKQWRADIREDGGTGRRVQVKKRKGSSSSSFISSGEEKMQSKSLLLVGPTGCGKTTAVQVAAKHYGFSVIEVNFSSKRGGKDVMRAVEEAVLSHRLKEQSLILFEDIDLVDDKEDEGFHSAVAQLITTAVRPIVMTATSTSGYVHLDPKLEKKQPLLVNFGGGGGGGVAWVEMVIKKVFSSSPFFEEMEEWRGVLESIIRHGRRGDIRGIINQAQWVLSGGPPPSLSLLHHGVEGGVDLSFVRPLPPTNFNEEEEEECPKKEVEAPSSEEFEGLVSMLGALTDLDVVLGRGCEGEVKGLFEDVFVCRYDVCGDRAEGLVLETELEEIRQGERWGLLDELCSYSEGGGWEVAAFIRSIIKCGERGKERKRGGRCGYFNRLSQPLIARVTATFPSAHPC